jgi:hypothetical protein
MRLPKPHTQFDLDGPLNANHGWHPSLQQNNGHHQKQSVAQRISQISERQRRRGKTTQSKIRTWLAISKLAERRERPKLHGQNKNSCSYSFYKLKHYRRMRKTWYLRSNSQTAHIWQAATSSTESFFLMELEGGRGEFRRF